MRNQPNVILRGGPADGQVAHSPVLGEPMPVEDVGGGSVTYVDAERVEYRDDIPLQVYEPRR